MSLEVIRNYSGKAGTVGPMVLNVEEDGGIIHQIDFEFGFSTRRIEDCLTKVSFVAGISYAEKIDFLAAPAGAVAYVQAVEQLAGIEITDRAKIIRVFLLELNRISSHLFFIAQMAASVGLDSIYYFCLREREKYCDLFELYCGSRVGFGAIKIGGVAEDASDGLLFTVEEILRNTESFLHELNEILTNDPIFIEQVEDVGILHKDLIYRH